MADDSKTSAASAPTAPEGTRAERKANALASNANVKLKITHGSYINSAGEPAATGSVHLMPAKDAQRIVDTGCGEILDA